MTRYVLDSFSLLAHFREEPGAPRVRQLIADRQHQHWVSVINLGEVHYKMTREHGGERADEVLGDALDMPIQLVEADFILAMDAARIKAKYRMSYADCFAAALAQRLNAAVVTGDPEFEAIERAGELQIEWLPPKPRTRHR
jgi:predicted nucleic acid-binding protein